MVMNMAVYNIDKYIKRSETMNIKELQTTEAIKILEKHQYEIISEKEQKEIISLLKCGEKFEKLWEEAKIDLCKHGYNHELVIKTLQQKYFPKED